MAESTPRKPSLSRKSLIAQALFVIMMLVTARVLWMRQQPEFLPVVPSSNTMFDFIALTDTTCYLPMRSGFGLRANETAICAQSVRNGDLHVIGKESDLYEMYSLRAGDNLVFDGKLYYMVHLRKPLTVRGTADSVSIWSRYTGSGMGWKDTLTAETAKGGSDLGTYLMSPEAIVSGRKRLSLTSQDVVPSEYRMRQLALSGGTPQDAPIPPATSCIMCEGHIFWKRQAVEQVAEVAQGETRKDRKLWKEVTAQSDLMLTSLQDGTTRCIRHGIYAGTKLVAGMSGIAWTEPALYPDPPTLFYARASDGRISRLGPFAPGKDAPACIELGDRLYWADMNASSPSYTLMTAKLDGSDVHEVSGITQKHQIGHIQLYAYRGNLYACLQEMSVGGREDYPISLCRLHPDRSDPIEIVRKVSGRGVAADAVSDFQFAGSYLYFQLTEPPGFWAKHVELGSQRTLCRVPLTP